MLFQILKKDLMKRKGVNMILFLFITLATVFLASSINNIINVSSGVDYYLEYANVPDINLISSSKKEADQIEVWLKKEKEEGIITAYGSGDLLSFPEAAFHIRKHDDTSVLDANGNGVYLGINDPTYCKVFDEQGKAFTLKKGEIALSKALMQLNDLSIGDTISLKQNNINIDFVVKEESKDAAYGSEMVGMFRLIISEEDYNVLKDSVDHMGLYYVMTPDQNTFTKHLDEQGFSTLMNTVTKSMYGLIYSFDLIMAALLILIGVCLILIALLVLRFTLVFTMEEQYKEIGILKAIGLRDFAIKRLYLVKYLVIVSSGALLGFFISIPISTLMVESISSNMIMESSDANIWCNVFSAFFIIVLVLAFCYFCTRKLNHVSAITSIRGGEDGERYHKRTGIPLYKRFWMPISIYLGLNDIVSHVKRYIVLIITFCISFILITIPLNTLNTMRSDEMARKFMIDPDSAIYVRGIEKEENRNYKTTADLKKGMKKLETDLKDHGYDAKAVTSVIFFLNYELANDVHKTIMSMQVIGEKNDFLQYLEGEAPRLENEIAISKDQMKECGWKIGDYVNVTIQGKQRNMLITGTYSDYMQLGKSARLNPIINTDEQPLFDYACAMVNMDSDMSQIELMNKLNKELPQYEWVSAQMLVDQYVGGIQGLLDQMLIPMTVMLSLVIMLITWLMEKLFITREKGEIAMMKSTGFTNMNLRNWQLSRMIWVVLSAMLFSIPLSLLSNAFILKPIFKLMGADVVIQVNALQVYLIYPGILLAGILLATFFATRSIKNINIREINHME